MFYILPAILLFVCLLGIFLAESQWLVPVDPRYNATLESAGIQHQPAISGKNTMHFVHCDESGVIYCVDYRYRKDTVYFWAETTYIPVSQYTPAQREDLLQAVKTRFETEESLSFCKVQYAMDRSFLTVSCTFSDVNKAENYQMLYDKRLIAENNPPSITSTQKALLKEGFIQK